MSKPKNQFSKMNTQKISKDVQDMCIYEAHTTSGAKKAQKKGLLIKRPYNEWTKRGYGAKKIGEAYYFCISEFCGRILNVKPHFWAAAIEFETQLGDAICLYCADSKLLEKLIAAKGELIDIAVKVKHRLKDDHTMDIYVEELYGIRSNKSFPQLVKEFRDKQLL